MPTTASQTWSSSCTRPSRAYSASITRTHAWRYVYVCLCDCVYVYICICVYVYMCICVYVCLGVWVFGYVCECVVCAFVWERVCVSVCVCGVHAYTQYSPNTPSFTLCRAVEVFKDDAKKYETLLRRLVSSTCACVCVYVCV
jgi:hypothetical protein